MISFTCDYNEGAHPEILRRLLETNMLQEPGVAAIFGPGTPVAYSAKVVMQLLIQE